jgi:hypothetical protein
MRKRSALRAWRPTTLAATSNHRRAGRRNRRPRWTPSMRSKQRGGGQQKDGSMSMLRAPVIHRDPPAYQLRLALSAMAQNRSDAASLQWWFAPPWTVVASHTTARSAIQGAKKRLFLRDCGTKWRQGELGAGVRNPFGRTDQTRTLLAGVSEWENTGSRTENRDRLLVGLSWRKQGFDSPRCPSSEFLGGVGDQRARRVLLWSEVHSSSLRAYGGRTGRALWLARSRRR